MEPYDNPWTYNGQIFDEPDIRENVGFVYLITNKQTGRQYIGKKLFSFKRARRVKSRKNRIITNKASNWKTYYGSSPALAADVEKQGKQDFKREILHLCASKTLCNYLEAKEQFVRGALESDLFYNDWISARIRKIKQLQLAH